MRDLDLGIVVGVQVDEPGRDPAALGVDDLGVRAGGRCGNARRTVKLAHVADRHAGIDGQLRARGLTHQYSLSRMRLT